MKNISRNPSPSWFGLLISTFFAINLFISFNVISASKISKDASSSGHEKRFHLVTKEERCTVAETEDGVISSVRIGDGFNGTYHLQFITLEPDSLLLPVLLHADMVFYVHSGSGTMRWIDEENKNNHIDVEKGDIYRFPSGSVFYMRSNLESTREKLRIYSIFTDSNIENPQSLYIGAYSTLNDLVRGFENRVLQTAFNVPEEVLDEITKASKPPAIVHLTTTKDDELDWRSGVIESLVKRGGSSSGDDYSDGKKKKKTKTVNLLKRKPDFSNCNGWSVAVNNKDVSALQDSDMGIFMVNLTKGSMMGPHWNPRASEIAIVTHGQGMITVVCPSNANESGCKNMRFKVKEGDVFTVPRFHPMAQMAYNNDSLVFMGFSTNARQNHPQFLAGKSSVFRTLNRDILAMSFNVPNTTMEQLLGSQVESIILECVSCAEEVEDRMREEEQRKRREEEARRREKEEAKRREEEEEARERQKQEQEERRREEEKRKEEEARRRQEEARREEEEARGQEEEREARRKEEELRKQEEAKRREEEEEAKRQEREEEQREQERQEKEVQQREEEEEEAQRRQEEARRQEWERQEREARRKEEEQRKQEEAKRREEEEEKRQEREEEQREEQEIQEKEAQQREEEEAQRRQAAEEAERKRQEEEARRAEEEEDQRQRQEEAETRKEEGERQQIEREEEEARRAEVERQQKEREEAKRAEEEEARRAEEEAQRRQEEKARRAEEEQRHQREEEEAETRKEEGERQQIEREEEEAKRAEVERQQKERETEEAKRAEQESQQRERESEEARQEEERRRVLLQ